MSAGIACAARFNRASEDSAGRDSLERLHRVDLDQAVWDLTERPPCLLAAAIAIKFPIVNWFIPVCALSEEITRTARRARSDPTYEAHTTWLTTDLLVIVVSLAIISTWIWIGP